MEELMTKNHIRYDLADKDMKFFVPKHKTMKAKTEPKHALKTTASTERKYVKPKKEKALLNLSKTAAIWILIGSIIFSGFGGLFVGIGITKDHYAEISHWQESVIRSEAIADYKAQLEEEQAQAAELETLARKDEAYRRQEEVIYFTKLFEGVRGWNFDMLDLITYGVCVWNRTLSPMFGDTVEEVIHQKGQWINYSDNNDVVADYKKIAEKLVDLLYNSDVQLCSSKYCWIEIKDGHLYLKDSFDPYVGMILWRYQGEV